MDRTKYAITFENKGKKNIIIEVDKEYYHKMKEVLFKKVGNEDKWQVWENTVDEGKMWENRISFYYEEDDTYTLYILHIYKAKEGYLFV